MTLSGHSETNGFKSNVFGNETNSSDLDSDKAFTHISFALGCVITIINIFALSCLIRHRKFVSGTGFWQQLIFLCLTDLLSGIAITVFNFSSFFSHLHPSIYYFICLTGGFLYPISMTSSAGNCCLISIQRYILVRKVNQQVTIWQKHTISLMILSNLVMCTVSVASSVGVVAIRFGFNPEEFCTLVTVSGNNDYKSTYILSCSVLIILFLLCTNIATVLSIIKMKNVNRVQPGTSSSTIQNSLSVVNVAQFQKERNRYATQTFILVILVLNLTIMPVFLFRIIATISEVNVSAETMDIIRRIMNINSLINPFIYSLRMNSFRSAVLNDIKVVWTRFKCYRDTT